jgi:hypothetical protein
LFADGAPIYRETFRLDDPIFLQPKSEQKIILDLLILKTLIEVSLDKTAIVTFFYNKNIQNSDKAFPYDFDLSKEKFIP